MQNTDRDWWRGGVIYQIYPRSFLDTNGDGVGDLEGIRRRLAYVAGLGVDAIWISPFFRSPMKDFGYDVSDYRDVDPIFGSLEDFDRLVEEAHRLGLRVVIDQVLSHTSDQHPWFEESRRDRDNPRADWYVWADAKADGTPPNNWLSNFGGSAWQWDTRRCQYYLHNFLASQPDLNYHNPAVMEAIVEEVRFWLERGVDGFRLDAINFAFHDPSLADNPPLAGRARVADNPYAFQDHVHDKSRPEMHGLLRRLRALAEEYGGAMLMGEIGDDDRRSRRLMAEYTSGGDKLHMAYSFDLLTDDGSAQRIRGIVEGLEREIGDGYPCWSIGNHDVPRVATRWGHGAREERVAPLYAALLLSLRGGICVYEGDELGLPEADIAYEDLQDPVGIAMWPRNKGRDGCRTPMPWEAHSANAGFSAARPWLPVPDSHRRRAVDRQDGVPGSVLEAFRRLLRWRKGQPALIHGALRFLDSPEDTLLIERCENDQRLLAAFNLGDSAARIPLPDDCEVEAVDGHGFGGTLDHVVISVPERDAFFGRIL
ncbi:MAG: alpha-amylase family glycosyl hydrolase [Ectothiorhodospiraceae bacterium]|jgi:alpha-glucosidase